MIYPNWHYVVYGFSLMVHHRISTLLYVTGCIRNAHSTKLDKRTSCISAISTRSNPIGYLVIKTSEMVLTKMPLIVIQEMRPLGARKLQKKKSIHQSKIVQVSGDGQSFEATAVPFFGFLMVLLVLPIHSVR
ncbi:hypothetical protein CDAR_570381 [Caerostris darwini]|uniref:Uncharacterized protein n=1 Tax=Caerostris darwini TaxID=1538125 RepID=A0AAV4MEG5_9ARAC|nr:hypothetical protein CDAR_570381 [Caerostris darwini]